MRFGRRFAPLVEEYRLDGADYAIMTLGSMTGAAKDAIDEARDAGRKVSQSDGSGSRMARPP